MGKRQWQSPRVLVALGIALAFGFVSTASAQAISNSPPATYPVPAGSDAAPPPPFLPPAPTFRVRIALPPDARPPARPDGRLSRVSLGEDGEGRGDARKSPKTPKPAPTESSPSEPPPAPEPASAPAADKVTLLKDLQGTEQLDAIRGDIQDADKQLLASGKSDKRSRGDTIYNLVKNTYAFYVGIKNADAAGLHDTQSEELRGLIAGRIEQDEAAPAAPGTPPGAVQPPLTPGADLSGGTSPTATHPSPTPPAANPGTPTGSGQVPTALTPTATTGGAVIHILVPNTPAPPATPLIPAAGPVQLLIPVGKHHHFPRLGLFRY